MSQFSQGSLSLATKIAIGIFLVAFVFLWLLGGFNFFLAVFLSAIIALIAWVVLQFGLGREEGDVTSGTPQSAAPDAKAAPAAAAETTSDKDRAAEAAEAKRAADAEAKERAAADEARQKVEAEEIAEAKRKADADAAEAKRAADEASAKRKAEEAEADQQASAQAATTAEPGAETTPDYDGDGVHEGVNEGTRPAGLDAPRDGQADDLKQIKGIGAKMEALCNRLGFWHFDQIAAWSADEVAWVDANLEGFKGRVTRDTWVEQAKVLAAGGETEFSKRVEDGDVY